MEVEAIFFDTYAFFEIFYENPNYTPYAKNKAIVTTRLNLMELHYGLLKEYGRETADMIYDDLLQNTLPIDDDTIKWASEFKSTHKAKKLSYVDCLGYILAYSKGIKFLTGDKEFANMPNVEYVK